MKKLIMAILIIAIIGMCGLLICKVVKRHNEINTTKNIDQTGDATDNSDSDSSEEDVAGATDDIPVYGDDYTEPIEKNGLKMEILDCEYMDTLYDYDGYKEEDMAWYVPDIEPDIMIESQVDYDAVYAEDPEYEKWNNNISAYSAEEGQAIFDAAQPIIEANSYDVEVPYDYVFLKIRYTNISEESGKAEAMEVCANQYQLIHPDSTNGFYEACFFDHPNKDDEKDFFAFTLQPGEAVECVVGFPIPEDESDGAYYYGMPDELSYEIDENTDGMYSPLLQTMYVRKVYDKAGDGDSEEN